MSRAFVLILLLTACTSQGPPESAASSELEAIGLVQAHLATIDVPSQSFSGGRTSRVEGASDCRTTVMASVSVWWATQTEDGVWEVQAGTQAQARTQASELTRPLDRQSVLRGTPAPAPPDHEWSLLPSGVVATTRGNC